MLSLEIENLEILPFYCIQEVFCTAFQPRAVEEEAGRKMQENL